MLDIDTCASEARTLHPSTDGWFATFRKVEGRKPIQKLYPMHNLDAVVSALDKTPESYISQASFIKARRLVSTFKSVNCAFVDIDCYSDKPNSPQVEPDDAFVQDLLAAARSAGLPEPSYVTFSGRGVYCKWVFDRPITAHQLTRWQALQNVLTPLYTAFGVDASARDAARVLRIMGSMHREADSVVRVALNTNQRHNFDALCKAAEAVDTSKLTWPSATMPAHGGNEKVPKIRKLSKDSALLLESTGDLGVLEQYAASRQPVMLKFGTRDHLNWTRFIDLRTLAELRGGIHSGSRDLMMFWMGAFLGHAGVVTADNLEQELGSLVGAFSGQDFDPIGDRSMTSLIERLKDKEAGRIVHFRGGSYSPLYTPTNDHLIDVLGITDDEQARMATIIGSEEKLRRADSKVPGRADRRQARIEWRGLAREMAQEAEAAGETRYISRIARAVGVDRSEVSRLLAGALDRDPKRIETRGRKKTAAKHKRIVIARLGGLTKSVWVHGSGSATTVDAETGEMGLATEAPPETLDSTQSGSGPFVSEGPTFKKLDFSTALSQSFPHRVSFSITRERREERGGFSKGEESKEFRAGGPDQDQKRKYPEVVAAVAVETQVTQGQEIWTGWGALAELSATRTRKMKASQSGTGKCIQSSVSIQTPETKNSVSTEAEAERGGSMTGCAVPAIASRATRGAGDLNLSTAGLEALRAEAKRLSEARKASAAASLARNQALMAAEREQAALKAVGRLEEIRLRAFSRNKT